MKIYITTDTHFFHSKMIEYCGRPENFDDLIWEAMGKLPPDCLLIHLGDVCFGGQDSWVNHCMLGFLYRKILIKGNHDKKNTLWYLQNGWDFVCDHFTATFFGKRILFSHKPMAIPEGIDLNIHGHFHNADQKRLEEFDPKNSSIVTNKHKLIALEHTNYKPVDLETLL